MAGECFGASLRDRLRQHAARPALFVAGRYYRYDELSAVASSLATTMDGIGRTPFVGILASRSLSAYAGIMATILGGRAYVPLNVDYPDDRLSKILSAARPDYLIVDAARVRLAARLLSRIHHKTTVILPETSAIPDELYDVGPHQVLTAADLRSVANGAVVQSSSDLASPMYLMFTSGTTGEPKGIVISRGNVATYLNAIKQLFDFRPEDRFSQFFQLSFDLSVHDLLVAWTAGACLYVPSELELLDPVGFARRHELTVWFSVPSMVSLAMRWRKLQPGGLPSLRHGLFCGEVLGLEAATRFAAAAPSATITNLYGPTEATIAITSYRLPEALGALRQLDSVPIGHPFPGQEIWVSDDAEAAVPLGKAGELWLAGSQLSSGYTNNPEQTTAKFLHRRLPDRHAVTWYRTGDLVEAHAEFGLIHRGRKDEQIKLRGHRIEIAEVEAALREAAGTDMALVAPWPMAETAPIETLVGIVCQPHTPAAAIKAEMRRRLPPFMVPSKTISVDEMVFNENQKLDRRKTVHRYLELIVAED